MDAWRRIMQPYMDLHELIGSYRHGRVFPLPEYPPNTPNDIIVALVWRILRFLWSIKKNSEKVSRWAKDECEINARFAVSVVHGPTEWMNKGSGAGLAKKTLRYKTKNAAFCVLGDWQVFFRGIFFCFFFCRRSAFHEYTD